MSGPWCYPGEGCLCIPACFLNSWSQLSRWKWLLVGCSSANLIFWRLIGIYLYSLLILRASDDQSELGWWDNGQHMILSCQLEHERFCPYWMGGEVVLHAICRKGQSCFLWEKACRQATHDPWINYVQREIISNDLHNKDNWSCLYQQNILTDKNWTTDKNYHIKWQISEIIINIYIWKGKYYCILFTSISNKPNDFATKVEANVFSYHILICYSKYICVAWVCFA